MSFHSLRGAVVHLGRARCPPASVWTTSRGWHATNQQSFFSVVTRLDDSNTGALTTSTSTPGISSSTHTDTDKVSTKTKDRRGRKRGEVPFDITIWPDDIAMTLEEWKAFFRSTTPGTTKFHRRLRKIEEILQQFGPGTFTNERKMHQHLEQQHQGLVEERRTIYASIFWRNWLQRMAKLRATAPLVSYAYQRQKSVQKRQKSCQKQTYKCEACSIIAISRSGYDRHLETEGHRRAVEGTDPLLSKSSLKNKRWREQNRRTGRYMCSACNKGYSDAFRLSIHTESPYHKMSVLIVQNGIPLFKSLKEAEDFAYNNSDRNFSIPDDINIHSIDDADQTDETDDADLTDHADSTDREERNPSAS